MDSNLIFSIISYSRAMATSATDRAETGWRLRLMILSTLRKETRTSCQASSRSASSDSVSSHPTVEADIFSYMHASYFINTSGHLSAICFWLLHQVLFTPHQWFTPPSVACTTIRGYTNTRVRYRASFVGFLYSFPAWLCRCVLLSKSTPHL